MSEHLRNAGLAHAYAGRRVLVIGGTGFIGHNLVVRLSALGARVTAASRGKSAHADPFPADVRFQSLDIAEIADLIDVVGNYDFIFSVAGRTGAAQSNVNVLADLRVNLLGQYNLLEACRQVAPRVRIVVASSRLVYGKPEFLPVTEVHPTNPTSSYGINTLAAEKYHLLYSAQHGLRSTVMRITVPYGPFFPLTDRPHGIVNAFIRTAAEGGTITIYGNGMQLRDVIYIDDLVDGMLLTALCEEACGRIYNIGSGQPCPLIDIARRVVDIAERGRIETVPWPQAARAVETGDFWSDTTRLRQTICWQPDTELAIGIARSLAYFRGRGGALPAMSPLRRG